MRVRKSKTPGRGTGAYHPPFIQGRGDHYTPPPGLLPYFNGEGVYFGPFTQGYAGAHPGLSLFDPLRGLGFESCEPV